MDVLLFSLNAIGPLILLAALGFMLRKTGLFTADFLKTATTFSFKFSFPALLFVSVYNIKHIADVRWDLVLFVVVAEVVVFVIGFLYVLFFVKDPRQKGVILQMFFRANYIIIGIPLAYSLGGKEGGAIASVLVAFVMPLFNVLGIIALAVFSPKQDQSKKKTQGFLVLAKEIITNPLILATIAAFICLLIRPYLGGWTLKTGEIRFIFNAIESLSYIASPLALIILGAGFTFSGVKLLLPQIIQGVSIRLVIVPLFIFFIMKWFFPHFGAAEHSAILLVFAVPTTIVSAIMAEQMGSDAELARQLVIWTSICSAFTLLLFTALLRSAGVF